MQTEVSTNSLDNSTRRFALGLRSVLYYLQHCVSNTLNQNSRLKHTVWTRHTANKRECNTICIVWGSALSACNQKIHLYADNRCPNIISEFIFNYRYLLHLETAMRQAKTLKDAEIKRVLAYCATRQHALRDTTIFVFSLNAGLRAKELAALRICDVYDSVGNVYSSFVLSAAATKGSRTRTVYVNKTLKRQLAQYYPTLPKQPTAPLFCSQKGSFFSANTMCQLLIHIFQQCSLKHATSHSGRRTFITRLASKGVGVRVLAELAGHSSIATTQRYIDVNAEQLANAVELV